ESLVLSLLGGLAGLLLGWWGTRALVALQPDGMLPVRDIAVNWTVVLYALGVTLVSGFLFGIAPALWGARRPPAEALKEGAAGTGTGLRVRRWSEGLVVVEVGLALLLTVGAGLLVRSFWRLTGVDPGFNPHGVLAVGLSLPDAKYDSTRVTVFLNQLEQRARALPGAEEVAVVSGLPLTGAFYTTDFKADGWPADRVGFEVAHRQAGPGYFHLMGVRLLRGRLFTDQDRQGSAPVILINQSLARQYFPGQDPVGRRIAFDRVPDSTSTWHAIVGVVGDERQTDLATPSQIEVFSPQPQTYRTFWYLLVKTGGDPSGLAGGVRGIVASLDPTLALESAQTLDEVYARSLVQRRFLLTLFMVFAGVGLALAAVGVYGVMAQLARGRVREIGIRVALGARTGQVQWLVVRRGLRLIAIGLGLGLVAALATTRLMTALLYQTSPSDPPTFLAVPALLALTGLAACWLPALRASRANPVVALREG
ncbi:MAG TPA: FtsX-like permease family protein, partial [Gemmatimonadales bacterium]|nr:FtsX-like permease family protein [Gemmatimonadales bacterium]